MTRWQFNENMIQMLKSIVGKQFLSFEMDSSVEGQSYGSARLSFDNTAILLKNEEEEIAMFENEDVPYEEASKFACSISDFELTFLPGIADVAVKKHEIDEIVTGVEIISDTIKSIEHDIDIIIDMAVVIKTEKHTYTFSKSHVWFDEVIYVNIDKDIEDICPVLSDLSVWNNDGEWDVKIERSVRKI